MYEYMNIFRWFIPTLHHQFKTAILKSLVDSDGLFENNILYRATKEKYVNYRGNVDARTLEDSVWYGDENSDIYIYHRDNDLMVYKKIRPGYNFINLAYDTDHRSMLNIPLLTIIFRYMKEYLIKKNIIQNDEKGTFEKEWMNENNVDRELTMENIAFSYGINYRRLEWYLPANHPGYRKSVYLEDRIFVKILMKLIKKESKKDTRFENIIGVYHPEVLIYKNNPEDPSAAAKECTVLNSYDKTVFVQNAHQVLHSKNQYGIEYQWLRGGKTRRIKKSKRKTKKIYN